MKKKVYLAVDLGADSGRVMAGIHDGQKIVLEEMARFPTGGIQFPDGWHWDLARIYGDIRKGTGNIGICNTGDSDRVSDGLVVTASGCRSRNGIKHRKG